MNCIRRSLLYIPADNEHMIEKAKTIDSDTVIFDLEDAVSNDNKDLAREVLSSSSVWLDDNRKEFFIRVNDVETPYFYDDIRLVIKLKPDAVILPKATEDAVAITDKYISSLEKDAKLPIGDIKLVPLLETAYGICKSYDIGHKSSRICAMQFGGEDFARDMEINRTKGGFEIQVARAQIAMACTANRIQAIDTPFTDFKDDDGLAEDCKIASQLGMAAKVCIHPRQISIVNNAFSPTESEIRQAFRIIESINLPENAGKGAFKLDGRMVDAPIIAKARLIIEKAKLYGIV